MPTRMLKLKLDKSTGIYKTRWTDDAGRRHSRCFGSDKASAYVTFSDFLSGWLVNPSIRTPVIRDTPLTVAEVVEAHMEHARDWYRDKDGNPTREHVNFEHATRELITLYANLSINSIGSKHIERIQTKMVAADLALNTINNRVRRIRQIFHWCMRKGWITADTLLSVTSVKSLTFRSRARMTEKVKPVADSIIDDTCKNAPGTLRAMIMVQRLTGMRPGELVIMRQQDIDQSGSVWIYEPYKHKTEHLDKDRQIPIGPQAQEYIRPYLTLVTTMPIFNPLTCRHEREVTHGRTIGRKRPRKTDRRVRDRYTVQSYYRAVQYECEKSKITPWSPNQLRHTWATEARRSGADLDAIQSGLGHSDVKTTQNYAGLSIDCAIAYAKQCG